jgi:hypothetical protein
MSITTYAELKTAISGWVHRADLSANLDDFVTAGEKWIMRKIRAPEMETALSVAISTTTGLATVPAGFLGLKYAYVDGSPTQPLEVRSPQQIFNRFPTRSSDSTPQWIGYDAGSFLFGPFPDSGYTVKGTYYKRQGPLSSGVYDLFSNNPDLYLYAALAETEPFIKNDKRVPLWIAKRDAIAKDINDEAVGILGAGGLSMITA